MKHLGGQCVYPVGNQGEFGPEYGLTYRQWMAGQIAGHMAGNNIFHEQLTARMTDNEETLRMFGLSIWVLTDAILDAEDAPPEKHEA